MSNAQNEIKRTKKRTHKIRKTILSVLLIVFLIRLTLYLGVISGLVGIHFPQLTGSYTVGRADYDLIDPSRHETFGKDPKARREIMVTVYYPANPPANAQLAPYAEGKMAEQLASLAHVPGVAVQLIHTHAYEHVPVADGIFPVVGLLRYVSETTGGTSAQGRGTRVSRSGFEDLWQVVPIGSRACHVSYTTLQRTN